MTFELKISQFTCNSLYWSLGNLMPYLPMFRLQKLWKSSFGLQWGKIVSRFLKQFLHISTSKTIPTNSLSLLESHLTSSFLEKQTKVTKCLCVCYRFPWVVECRPSQAESGQLFRLCQDLFSAGSPREPPGDGGAAARTAACAAEGQGPAHSWDSATGQQRGLWSTWEEQTL